jgi:predicted nucleic acid-binding protein
VTTYLVDTSAYARLHRPAVRDRFNRLARRDLRIAFPLLLEVGWSARNAEDHERQIADLQAAYPVVHASAWSQNRAVEVQRILATQGHHRSAGLADLITAAIAEQHDLTVLHYDADFDVIAQATGQPCEWVTSPKADA